jgi:DNA/RNA endonuclease YhcR with UshA esterase domain
MEKENNPNLTPEEERYQKETHCPSCGRFTGIFTRCPYCQALVDKRLSIKAFKLIAVLTSTIGLMMLLFYAQHVETPAVMIKDLGPLSNFAHVRVTGKVERSFGIHPQWGSLGFIIEQEEEGKEPLTIRVSAYSKVAREIEKRNLVPAKGDEVSVEGQVRFQKDSPSLLINAPEHIKIVRKSTNVPEEIKNIEPDKLSHSNLNTYVCVTGSVLTTKSFPSGMIINIDDGKSGLPVWLPKQHLEPGLTLNPGDLIEATGIVETFKDKLEVKITKENSFRVISRVSTTEPAEEED